MNLAVDPAFFDLLAGSYSRLVGASLIPPEHDNQHAVRWLYEEAPYCVLVHNTDADPVFIYGNKTAQACFEYAWDELTSLRSRLSAEEPNREERQRFLEFVQRHAFACFYRQVDRQEYSEFRKSAFFSGVGHREELTTRNIPELGISDNRVR